MLRVPLRVVRALWSLLGLLALFVLLALAVAACPASGADAGPLEFSAVPLADPADPAEGRRRFEPLADHLAARLGVAVRYLPTGSDRAALAAFREGRTQLAWLDGFTGLRARAAVPGAQPLAQGLEDRRTSSCFIMFADTRYPWLGGFGAGVRGKSMLFGPATSTSGRVMPEGFVRGETGMAPGRLFGRVAHSAGPLETIARVQAGEFQVGALACGVWDRELRAGRVISSAVRLLWRTPPYADRHWTVRGGLDAIHGPGFTGRLRQALLDITGPALLTPFSQSGFVPATEPEFDPVRQAAGAAGLSIE